MNPQLKQEIVPFKDINILTFSEQDSHFIAIRPLCDQFGIDWSSQYRKIQRDTLFNSTVAVMTTVGSDGKQREMICLPLKMFPMWLARIETRRLKNKPAARLILKFQKEATQVLYEHFMRPPTGQSMQLRFKMEQMEQKYKQAKKKIEKARLKRKIAHTDWSWAKLETMHALKELITFKQIGKIYGCSGSYAAQLERQYRYATGKKVAELPRALRGAIDG